MTLDSELNEIYYCPWTIACDNVIMLTLSYFPASISKDCFFKTHPTCATIIKGQLTPGNTAILSPHLCEEFNDHLENLGSEGSGQLNELIKYSLLTSIIYIVLKFPLENKRHAFHTFKSTWLTQKLEILWLIMPLHIIRLCLWKVDYNKAVTKFCWFVKKA